MDPQKAFPSESINEELAGAGLLGEGVSDPDTTSSSTSQSSMVGEVPPYLAPLTIASAVTPYVLSDWERTNYYSGISQHPPELLYRSDFLGNPFPTPKCSHSHCHPTKTVHGVFNTPLNTVWDTVAPQIRDFLKARKIRYSAIQTARFVTEDGKGVKTRGPIVIWIATNPTSTTAENAHEASQAILSLLKDNGVEGVVVEWYGES